MRVRRRRERRVAEARRKRREDEVPVEHGQTGIGGQPVRRSELVQRLDDKAARDERPARNAEDGCVGQPETLGRNGRSEVDLVAHENVGGPLRAHRQDRICALAGDPTRERVADGAGFALRVDREKRCPLVGRQKACPPEAKAVKPGRFDRRDHPILAGERNDVARTLGGARDRNERQEMPCPAGERETAIRTRLIQPESAGCRPRPRRPTSGLRGIQPGSSDACLIQLAMSSWSSASFSWMSR